MITKEIEKALFENQDLVYRDFQAKLTPTVSKEKIIGVRTPVIRSLAKKFYKEREIEDFLNDLPHPYYDENNLHGFIISEEKNYQKAVDYVDKLLPFVNNWATCDLLSPKAFKKNKTLLKTDILRWISSDKTYTIRFGIEMAMSHFLDDDFSPELMQKISEIKSDEYYVNMMIAWYFATALCKKWNFSIEFLKIGCFSPWVQNKTIQKARESYRITPEQKEYLQTLKK